MFTNQNAECPNAFFQKDFGPLLWTTCVSRADNKMRTALDALSAEPMAPQSGYRPPRVAAACRRGSSCVTSTRSRTHSSLRTCATTCTLISCNWQQAAAPTSSSRSNAISLAASALNAKIAYALGLLFPIANCLPVPNMLHFCYTHCSSPCSAICTGFWSRAI
jgi:hypothetical protein